MSNAYLHVTVFMSSIDILSRGLIFKLQQYTGFSSYIGKPFSILSHQIQLFEHVGAKVVLKSDMSILVGK